MNEKSKVHEELLKYTKGKKYILVLSQRDVKHPYKGGAEVYTHNALITLATKMPVVHISVCVKGKPSVEIVDNICYLRLGSNLLSVIFCAINFYFKNKENILAVIDQSNTHQFFTFLWARKKRIFFIHQLTQEIWGYFYGKCIGFICRNLENLLLSFSRGDAITVSQSTEQDLLANGFTSVRVCPEGNNIVYTELPEVGEKDDYLVYTGRLVDYKRVEDAVLLAKAVNKKLIIIGHGSKKYESKLQRLVREIDCDCDFKGFVSSAEKRNIVEKAHLLIMPSIREGWGLVITESGNLGTPSMVYKSQGTYEATNYGKAGFVADEANAESLAARYRSITEDEYIRIRKEAFEFSKQFTWDKTSDIFCEQVLNILDARGIKYAKK